MSELVRAEIREYVAPMFEQIMVRMDTLATKEDLNEVKADVSELKVGLNEVRADVSVLKTDVSESQGRS